MANPETTQEPVSQEVTVTAPAPAPQVGMVQAQVMKDVAVVVPDYPVDHSNDVANW